MTHKIDHAQQDGQTKVERAEQQRGNELAVRCEGQNLTFRELATRCRKLAGALDALGLARGDRVAILSANNAAYVEVYLGVPAAGYVVVPLNLRHAEPELRYALEDSATRVLITDRDPGVLAEVVEHVVMLPGDYDTMVDIAIPTCQQVGPDMTCTHTLTGLFSVGTTYYFAVKAYDWSRNASGYSNEGSKSF